MNYLRSVEIVCPYCGEVIEIEIDCSAGNQQYMEDCQVCCRPINIDVTIDTEGNPFVTAKHEDEI